jgi:glycosyltransferase involved in cell wall biosynthesis
MPKPSRPLHVAILGSRGYPYVYSGYETLVKELAERLVKKGIKVTVYCHKSLFEEKPSQVNGINLVYVPGLETKTLSQLSTSFFGMIHACFSSADVLLVVNSANGPFGLISRVLRKPTAINVDGMEWLRPKWKGMGAKYFLFASRLSTKLYDRIITDCEEMQKTYLEMFNSPSVMIAYGANSAKRAEASTISKWDLEERGYYLIVGRLVPDNNADLIIEGFVKSSSKRKLVIVGDVPYQDDYAQRLKNMADERLVFTGYVKDQEELASLYHNCYAYYHGHEYGGTNPAMLKAMGFGCAILALNTRFNREMLQGSTYGWYFDKEAASVASTTDKAEASPRKMEELRRLSIHGLTNKYNWEHVTEKYLKVFIELKQRK